MPKVLTFDDIGLKGLNTDVSPWSLPPEFFTEAKNFRIFANQVISAGGSELLATPPVQFYPGYIQHAEGVASPYWLVAGRDAVYTFDSQAWVDISSASGYASIGVDQELNWSGCQVGQFVILNNPQIAPEYWSQKTPSQQLESLPWVAGVSTWDDVGQQCRIMRSHKQWMFALNLIDNGVEVQDGIRWSHPAEANGLPASWDENDRDYLAGKVSLGGDSGQIIDGRSLRDSFVVYSSNGINIFDESSEFIWRRRELSATAGLLSPNCLVEIKGQHFFISEADCLTNNGTAINSIMHNRIRKRLSSRLNQDAYNNSFAVRNDAFKEIWFCVPEDGDTYPAIAYVYNWKDDSWAIRDLPGIVYANYGSLIQPALIWDDWQGTWDGQRGFWGSQQVTPLNDTIIAIERSQGRLFTLDVLNDPTPYDLLLERTDFPLDGHPKVTTITRVYPHCSGTQILTFEFGSQDYAGGPVRWKAPITFNPNTDRKIDVRTTGELHAWSIRAVGNGSMQLSGMTFEYEDGGYR